MPESAEVRTITDKLRSRLVGKDLLSISWTNETKFSTKLRESQELMEKVLPVKCLEILCKGKQIFFFFEGDISFVSGLGMEGHWYYFDAWGAEETKYSKFCLKFGHVTGAALIHDTNVLYDDMRNFGNFTIGDWKIAFNKIKENGPDLLAIHHPFIKINPEVLEKIPEEFHVRITEGEFHQKVKTKEKVDIGTFLMEQKYYSGIGNYIRSEVLYQARIHPNRLIMDLSSEDISRLYQAIVNIIDGAYQSNGLTHGTFLDPDMKKGTFEVKVYKKEGEKDEHGYTIKRITVKGKRSVYLVEELQI